MCNVRFLPAGDRAIVVEFGTEMNERTNRLVHELAAYIKSLQPEGVVEVQPTIRSLMIYFDPAIISVGNLQTLLSDFHSQPEAEPNKTKRILKVPCCYGARFGIDIAGMERHTGLLRDEIISIHSGVDYKIYMLGFLPGFVYLGGLDKRLETPRLNVPRLKIQAGAVGIGGSQTGIYPMDSPGGWHLIGATPLMLYNPYRNPPILCSAGMYIRFVPITITDYYDIRRDIVMDRYTPEIEEKVCFFEGDEVK